MLHFLSVSNGYTSILSDILITLQKSRETIFSWVFLKITNTCKRCFWDVSEMSRNTHLFWNIKTTYRRHTKGIFFEMFLGRLKDVTKKTSFLKCIWGVLKTSRICHIFWNISEKSLRCPSQWRSDWDLSETCHAGWDNVFSFNILSETVTGFV